MIFASTLTLGPPRTAREASTMHLVSSATMSSMILTPWPSRSAPHHCTASQMDGSPKPSPAWMVKWKFSRATYWNASRCLLGGLPASALVEVGSDHRLADPEPLAAMLRACEGAK